MARTTIWLTMVAGVFLSSGCTITISPGVESIEKDETPAIGKGACTPKAGAGSGMIQSKFELNTFQIDRAAWSSHLAKRLADELKQRGVDVAQGPELTVSVTDYRYNQTDFGVTVFSAQLGIEVTMGDFKKSYVGDQASPLSSSNAAWQAAGNALSKLMADPEFRAAVARN